MKTERGGSQFIEEKKKRLTGVIIEFAMKLAFN
jgi:hypothetical protein